MKVHESAPINAQVLFFMNVHETCPFHNPRHVDYALDTCCMRLLLDPAFIRNSNISRELVLVSQQTVL